MTDAMVDPAPEVGSSRRARILDAAAHAFATHGYRGSSLREIAREAGCSVTLLDHHFGDKSALLDAALKQQHENCEARLAGLRAAIHDSAQFSLDDFVARWAAYEFELYATPDGRRYLELLLRLSTEAEVEAQRRRDLDCSQALVVKAFARARPSLDEHALKAGWALASATLYAAVVSAGGASAREPESSESTAAARRRVVAFVVEGLKGCWRDG